MNLSKYCCYAAILTFLALATGGRPSHSAPSVQSPLDRMSWAQPPATSDVATNSKLTEVGDQTRPLAPSRLVSTRTDDSARSFGSRVDSNKVDVQNHISNVNIGSMKTTNINQSNAPTSGASQNYPSGRRISTVDTNRGIQLKNNQALSDFHEYDSKTLGRRLAVNYDSDYVPPSGGPAQQDDGSNQERQVPVAGERTTKKRQPTPEQRELKHRLLELAAKATSSGPADEGDTESTIMRVNKKTGHLELVKVDPNAKVYVEQLRKALKALSAKKLPAKKLKSVLMSSEQPEASKGRDDYQEIGTAGNSMEIHEPEEIQAEPEYQMETNEPPAPLVDPSQKTQSSTSKPVGPLTRLRNDQVLDDIDNPGACYEDEDQCEDGENVYEATTVMPFSDDEEAQVSDGEPNETESVLSKPVDAETQTNTDLANHVYDLFADRLDRIKDLLYFRPEHIDQIETIDDHRLTPLESEFKRMVLCAADERFCQQCPLQEDEQADAIVSPQPAAQVQWSSAGDQGEFGPNNVKQLSSDEYNYEYQGPVVELHEAYSDDGKLYRRLSRTNSYRRFVGKPRGGAAVKYTRTHHIGESEFATSDSNFSPADSHANAGYRSTFGPDLSRQPKVVEVLDGSEPARVGQVERAWWPEEKFVPSMDVPGARRMRLVAPQVVPHSAQRVPPSRVQPKLASAPALTPSSSLSEAMSVKRSWGQNHPKRAGGSEAPDAPVGRRPQVQLGPSGARASAGPKAEARVGAQAQARTAAAAAAAAAAPTPTSPRQSATQAGAGGVVMRREGSAAGPAGANGQRVH